MSKNQLSLNLYLGNWGGRRPGSGRKRIHSKGVAHRTRGKVTHRTPVHINFKYRTFIKNKFCLKLLKRAIMNARKQGLRVNQFSLQSNHVHLIIEAENNEILTRGMRSLTITFAKGLNKGKVQIERYHLHVLKTIKEAKHAVQYVLFNQQKHGAAGAASDGCKDLQSRSRKRREEKGTYSKIDEYSSLLSMKNAVDLIRNFARDKKMTLKVEIRDKWIRDEERSFLLKEGLTQL
ncbi:hypothetical protein ACJVC5_10480 [Peredibacter sp. HCB2-198]|uniref:hypothetical protein n=1 Tax=Peredibacter sp. HCB2-198 TaxID=3383025 RepID=UPI0038B55CE5